MLQKWDDINADKHALLSLNRHKLAKSWGLALTSVNALLASQAEGKKNKEALNRQELEQHRIDVLTGLGEDWNFIKQDVQTWTRFLSKDSFEPF